jgi:hypothetical protein
MVPIEYWCMGVSYDIVQVINRSDHRVCFNFHPSGPF